jgi:hypothetical protein
MKIRNIYRKTGFPMIENRPVEAIEYSILAASFKLISQTQVGLINELINYLII